MEDKDTGSTQVKTQEAQDKKVGAKVQSRLAMAFSSVWIAVLTILKGFSIVSLDLNDIVLSGVAIVAVWTPTYLSIVLDKIKGIKGGV